MFTDPRLSRAVTLLAMTFFAVLLVRYSGNFTSPPPSTPLPLVIEVLGDVSNPGVHLMQARGTSQAVSIAEAVNAAGGPAKCSSVVIPDCLHDQTVKTGQRIRVTCDTSDGLHFRREPMNAGARLTLGQKLDLNGATEEELSLIPSMKPEFAGEIIRRRLKKPWRHMEELQEIVGVGPKTVEKWMDHLTVD